jgi:hypothetical protein
MVRYGTSVFGPVELVFALTTERRTVGCRAALPDASPEPTVWPRWPWSNQPSGDRDHHKRDDQRDAGVQVHRSEPGLLSA